MRHDQILDPNVAAKLLLAGIIALAIAIGLFAPLPSHTKPDATRSQIPTLEVGKG